VGLAVETPTRLNATCRGRRLDDWSGPALLASAAGIRSTTIRQAVPGAR
jgi:hypothetical protein